MTIISELIYWLIAYTIYKIITKIKKTNKSTYKKLYSVSQKTNTTSCSDNSSECTIHKNYSSIESADSKSLSTL